MPFPACFSHTCYPPCPGMDIAATPGGASIGEGFAHWQGCLVYLPGGTGSTAVVRGPGSDGRSLRVQPGVYEEQWRPTPGVPEQLVDALALRLVAPSKKDRVKILGEIDSVVAAPGVVGSLIGIDGLDGIVRGDNTTDLTIIDLRLLGKLVLV